MLVAPLLLTVGALLPVGRIVSAFLPVILSPASTLACWGAADDLLWVIRRRRKDLLAVRASMKCHYSCMPYGRQIVRGGLQNLCDQLYWATSACREGSTIKPVRLTRFSRDYD